MAVLRSALRGLMDQTLKVEAAPRSVRSSHGGEMGWWVGGVGECDRKLMAQKCSDFCWFSPTIEHRYIEAKMANAVSKAHDLW